MHFSKGVVATALAGMAAAQKVHVVSVSSANGTKAFYPDNLSADVGDMIQFQFLAGNHSVVQSNFDNPCIPIQAINSSATGMFSGYMDVAASESTGMIPVYTMEVKAATPVWLYCSQATHCQAGMVMVVNENTNANSTRSLDNFKQIASTATENLDPTKIDGASSDSGDASGGTTSSIPSPTSTVAAGLGSAVSVSAWTGLLSIAAALALF
ncbi:Cupredoxin [Xylaria arbuscula]|uniref:Extracellular serine-rich protein n=1 Tax=Xylaria arbuscula TaxID=114810 RepID=A0A9W8TP41_9PEZI|nr:Cupredoxin [Xylaria arbuscula]KAJ3575792.1 hypothetical protein NPX13_g3911 [Xylaria arbuscula]